MADGPGTAVARCGRVRDARPLRRLQGRARRVRARRHPGRRSLPCGQARQRPHRRGAPAHPERGLRDQRISLTVTNENDILYAYAENAAVSTAPTDDFANLQALLKPAAAAGGGVDPCAAFKTQLGNLEDAIQKEPNLNPTQSGSGYASISLGN